MKKLFLSIYLFLLCLLQNYPIFAHASTSFARAEQNINLYKLTTNSDELTDILCIVEKSYFVEIISDNGDNYRVNYNGVTGYVKKNDVKEVLNTPNTPYPYNIKLVLGSDCNLRSTPTTKSQVSNIITSLQSGESEITFIGRIFSDEAIDFGGTTWYYVYYQGNYGYIYNKYVKSITPIYENTEESIYKSDSSTTVQNPITHTPSLIIIIIMLIPCILILFILYLPRNINKKPRREKTKKIIDRY